MKIFESFSRIIFFFSLFFLILSIFFGIYFKFDFLKFSLFYWLVFFNVLFSIFFFNLKSSHFILFGILNFILAILPLALGLKSFSEIIFRISLIFWLVGLTLVLIEYIKDEKMA